MQIRLKLHSKEASVCHEMTVKSEQDLAIDRISRLFLKSLKSLKVSGGDSVSKVSLWHFKRITSQYLQTR